jgi:membrane fusion protein (multidrug efflux system)
MQNTFQPVQDFRSRKNYFSNTFISFRFYPEIITSLKFITAVASLSMVLSGCGKKAATQAPGRGGRGGPVQVEVMVTKPELLLNTVSATGTILANERAEIRPEVSGRIVKILFEEGAVVPKNKLLVKMNDSDLQAQLKRNEAQGILLASDELQKRKLLEIKAVSQDEYDVAKSQLLVNQADRQLLEAQIAKTEIYAPFTGKVGLRAVSVGNYVASNTLIATIQQLDPVKIEFDVPEKYSSQIKPGLELSFTTDASDSTFTAKIYAIESAITTETRTLKVRALCPNPKGMLNPGTFARVNIVLEKFPDAIKVPSEAVSTILDGNSVFVCRNGKAVATKVKTGIRTEYDIQITEGLLPGDSLIITGLLQLTDGSAVNVKKPRPDQQQAQQQQVK